MSKEYPANRHYEIGDNNAAQSWLATFSLSDTTKEALLQFTHRFPTLTFYKENAAFLDHLEETESVKLPAWFRAIRQVLAYVMPNQQVEVQFGNFDDADMEDLFADYWYMFGLGYNEAQRELLESMEEIRLFPIGGSLEQVGSVLAINLADPADQQVYEYNMESLWDNIDDGQPLSSAVGKAFDSYATMFRHIVAIKVQIGEETEVIQAQA